MLALSFLHPGLLWLLLLVPALAFWPRRAALGDRIHLGLRAVVLALVVVALAAPVRVSADRATHHVFLVDASASAGAAGLAAGRRALERLLGELDPAATCYLVGIGFGAEDAGRHRDRFAAADRLEGATSDLPAALVLAALRIPAGSRGAITLLGDGRSTDPQWGAALQALTARGIPLHTVALTPPAAEVRPVALRAATELRVGQTGRVLVDVVATAAEVVVQLADGRGTVAESAPVRVDGRRTVALQFEPAEAGFVPYTATVQVKSGTDPLPADNSIGTLLPVQDPIRVLYLGGRVAGSRDKLAELLGKGFTLHDGGEGADHPDGLAGYDLVMLDDRAAAAVPRPLQRQIVAAVTDTGLGLVMSGGSGSFGPGGYQDTPIAGVLPVELVQKEEKKDPSTALAIIIDTSGSMGGNRIVLAKEVTRLALRRLLPHDKVGIVEFFGNKRWAAPLQSAANAIDIQRALNRLDAGGGTILFPAIEEAYFGLRNVQTRYKHVLVLTDAGVESGPYEQLMRRMARDGICVSTVLVGPGRHSEFLVELADWGRGRFYNASDRFNLPEIMLKQPSSARLPGYRAGEQPVDPVGGPGWWGDVDPATTPPIGGYVETRKRPGADVILRTSKDHHPVLASWRFGLGRVTAMTTEPTGQGTAGWKDWPGFGPFLGRVLSRTADVGRVPFRFELVRQGSAITVTATRLDRSAVLPRAATVGAEPVELRFAERAPGRFAATLPWPPDQPARIVAGVLGRSLGERRLASAAHGDLAPEHNVDPRRALDLAAAATATGGNSRTAAAVRGADLTAGGGGQPVALQRLWPLCLLLALLAYLGDLLWRRRPQRSRSTP